jgi:TPR repeat protein
MLCVSSRVNVGVACGADGIWAPQWNSVIQKLCTTLAIITWRAAKAESEIPRWHSRILKQLVMPVTQMPSAVQAQCILTELARRRCWNLHVLSYSPLWPGVRDDLVTGCGWQDKTKAFELYTKAGEMGSLPALENLAAMYAAGEGVPRNEKTAQYLLSIISKQRAE